jgi:rubredoxin
MSDEHISVSQYFECPDCKHDYLEEIQVDMVLASRMTDIHIGDSFAEAEYSNDVDWYGGVVDRYQCVSCAYIVRDEQDEQITDMGALAEWLQAHKENREKELNTP